MTKNELTKEFIKDTFIKNNKFISGRLTKQYLQKHNYYDAIINYYDDSKSIKETLYRIIHDIDEIPHCKMCTNKVSFKKTDSYNMGYSTYCCKKCQNSDPYMRDINSKAVSKSLKQKYKDDGDNIKEKRRQTIKEKYNVDTCTPFGVRKINEKAKNTVLKNHNGKYPKRPDNQPTAWKLSIELQKERGLDISYFKDKDNQVYITIHNCCPIHGDITLTKEQFNRRTNYNRSRPYLDLCIKCNPEYNPETSLEKNINKGLSH